MVTVTLEPDGKTLEFEKVNTALQLLHRLELKPVSALVIREGRLLTPDQKIHQGDKLTVRIVTSRG